MFAARRAPAQRGKGRGRGWAEEAAQPALDASGKDQHDDDEDGAVGGDRDAGGAGVPRRRSLCAPVRRGQTRARAVGIRANPARSARTGRRPGAGRAGAGARRHRQRNQSSGGGAEAPLPDAAARSPRARAGARRAVTKGLRERGGAGRPRRVCGLRGIAAGTTMPVANERPRGPQNTSKSCRYGFPDSVLTAITRGLARPRRPGVRPPRKPRESAT